MSEHPKGILRNNSTSEQSRAQQLQDKLDRQEVIKNTRLNAKLNSDSSKGDEIRAKIAQKKKELGESDDPDESKPEHLKWDELNIYKNEQEKSATMKIDEPKTPYEGGFNPEGEYYKDDEDQNNGDEDIPQFDLGEGEYDKLDNDNKNESSLHGSEVIKDPNQDDEGDEDEEKEPQEEQLTAEERHKRFEEKRKEHYHLKALPLKHKIDIPDDDNDNDSSTDATV
ncbi:uncharacterized protein KGF55_001124 [Candida pseudojiufengensis]|uniref:uncharacterized protein n=1 Tax=Candida pseudojiufengensis TaxID=497109 RepID=UPI0022251E02|nr:uncharacterized protein KGF55_001124 [Candida pseudojiufengensis]KAI5965761.1 hypothetical protein KGF55_001124 [Candida pseudojiufengensis]